MDEGRRMVYLRIYSGMLKVGDEVHNTPGDIREKIARLFDMHAHQKQRIEQASAGDIVAVVGLKESVTGDTLCAGGGYLCAGAHRCAEAGYIGCHRTEELGGNRTPDGLHAQDHGRRPDHQGP